MAHRHAHLMKILAQQILDGVENPGALWEFKYPNAKKWTECLGDSLPCFHENMDFRLKPKFININGFDVPEPERVAPKQGQFYYSPWPFAKKGISELDWNGSDFDLEALKNGVVHLVPENAAIHGKAIYSFTRVQPDLSSGDTNG